MGSLAKTKGGGTIDMADQLVELNNKFNEIMTVMEKDRKSIEDHIDFMKQGLREVRAYSHMSEEGALEKQINEAYKQLNACNKRIDTIIDAVTKIVSAKILAEASVKPDGEGLTSPIDISSAKR